MDPDAAPDTGVPDVKVAAEPEKGMGVTSVNADDNVSASDNSNPTAIPTTTEGGATHETAVPNTTASNGTASSPLSHPSTNTPSSETATAPALTSSVTHNNTSTNKPKKKKKKKISQAKRLAEEQAEKERGTNSDSEEETRGRGRVPWATGQLEQFMLDYMPQYQTEIVSSQKKAPPFYNTVLKELFLTHGWGMFFVWLVEHGVVLSPTRSKYPFRVCRPR